MFLNNGKIKCGIKFRVKKKLELDNLGEKDKKIK